MVAKPEDPQSPGSPGPDEGAKKGPQAVAEPPLARIWSDPVGVGETVPFDPAIFELGMSEEEFKKLLGESDKPAG
jgi:hypothetical protein